MPEPSDWHPGRNSNEFRMGWDRIFGGVKTDDDDEQVKAALKYFKQDACCGCDCSNRKPK